MKKNAIRVLTILLIVVMMPFPAFAVNEDYIPISIDGYYDDWEDKPYTEVYPGKNPPESKINYVSLFRDEDNVYVHVLFAYKNNQDITNMTIDLYTNMGDEKYFLVPDFWYPDTELEPEVTPDQNTDISPLEETPPADQGGAPESTEQDTTTTESTEQDTTMTESPEQNTTTTGSPETTDTTNTTNTTESTDTTEQNILAGHNVQSYVLVADNDKTDPAADPEADPATVSADTTTVTTDEKTNNGQGNDSGNNESTVTDTDAGEAATAPTKEKTNNGQGNGSESNNGQGNTTETPVPDTGTATEPGIITNPSEDTDLTDILDILNPDKQVDLDSVLDQFTSNGAIDASAPADSADLNSNLNLKKPGWYGTWGFTVWDGLFPVGSGFYTRSEGEPDELELYIPLSSISHDYDGIKEISMRIKKLGPQHIMCTGVSTGAYIGVAAGAGIALLSVGAYTFRRKQPLFLSKGKQIR